MAPFPRIPRFLHAAELAADNARLREPAAERARLEEQVAELQVRGELTRWMQMSGARSDR